MAIETASLISSLVATVLIMAYIIRSLLNGKKVNNTKNHRLDIEIQQARDHREMLVKLDEIYKNLDKIYERMDRFFTKLEE